jgi:hypothetical protein
MAAQAPQSQCYNAKDIGEVTVAVDMLNVEGLKQLDQRAPVVMLNLMHFHARSLDGEGSG